jgi:hypothetical protein
MTPQRQAAQVPAWNAAARVDRFETWQINQKRSKK